ncbi:MAG: nucleotidyltransferase domain-containing protein [Actinomycetota bacterium]
MVKRKVSLRIEEKICEKLDIQLVYLFGSYVRGDKNFQDIDIAILINLESPDIIKEMEIAESFKNELTKNHPNLPIQVTPLNSANPLLRYEVIKEGRAIYASSNEERIAFEMKTLREYGDYKAKSRFYEMALKNRLKE